MGLKTKLALTAFLVFCPLNSEINFSFDCQTKTENTINKDYYTISDIRLKKASSLNELISRKKYAYQTSRENLVNNLSGIANNKEFSLAYFENNEILVNLMAKSRTNSGELNSALLDNLVDTGNFRLIHNHNNLKLEDSQKTSLSRIGLSPTDINQYFFLKEKYPKINYSVITEYGMLTVNVNFKKFNILDYPSVYEEAILFETMRMQSSLARVNPDSITLWAENYRGILKLSFEKSDKIK